MAEAAGGVAGGDGVEGPADGGVQKSRGGARGGRAHRRASTSVNTGRAGSIPAVVARQS